MIFLVDGAHKDNLYDLNLIVTIVINSLGISVPVFFWRHPPSIPNQLKKYFFYYVYSNVRQTIFRLVLL